MLWSKATVKPSISGFEPTAAAIGAAPPMISGRQTASLGRRWSAAVTLALAIGTHAAAVPVQIDAAATQQIIRGFGGATVFQPPGLSASLSSTDLDSLFGTGPGQIGLTLLRIRVASDDAWRAVELGHAQGAIARGAAVIATPWSPPAAMKSNNSIIDGSLNASAYADYAKYLNDFALYMAANGAPLYGISVQNEPDVVVTYESCEWTPAQMFTFCKNNAGAISATRVIMPESFQFRRVMSDSTLNDDTAVANIDIVGGHIYGGGLSAYPLAVAKGKEVWMTEHYSDQTTDWTGALGTGKEIHDCLATANFSAYIWWYLRRFYGPLGEDGVVTKRGWVMAQFSKFIRPGFVRVTATANPATNIFVSAYTREKLVIVALNLGTADATQTFSMANATVNAVAPWQSSSTTSLAALPLIPVAGGTFSATLPAGSVTTFVGDLIFPAPLVVTPPQSHNVAAGSTAVLNVATNGQFVAYQWTKNGVPLPGATAELLTLPTIGAADAGSYAVTLTNSGGTVTSAAATIGLSPAGSVGHLTNISTRSLAQTGDNVLIAGFVISGNAPKQVLMRASGPALQTLFGLTGVLDDPTIEVRDARTGAVVASNDNWDTGLASAFTAVGAFPWSPGSKDAALVATLPPGGYTAIVRGNGGTTGIALVEVYDADGHASPALSNISTRSVVGTDAGVQIGGFVLNGGTAKTVVIRATGPTLHKSFGVSGALNDPVIELRSQGHSEVIATSDDWSSSLAPHFAAVGAFPWPTGSRDAAIVTTLEPGAYSVVVRGKGTGTGVALFEVYAEP